MAPTQGGAKGKPKGARHKSNALHKKRRQQRSMPKTNKKTAKNRIRDMERRLRKLRSHAEGADPALVARLEAEVAALKGDEAGAAADRKRVQTEKRYAERYHKVKFFERRKVVRRLKQLRKALAAGGADVDDLRTKERTLEDDLLYIKHYPKDQKYVSLFGDRAQDDKTAALRTKMRAAALANAAQAKQHQSRPDDDDDDDTSSDDSDSDSDSDSSDDSSKGAAAPGGDDSDDSDDEESFFLPAD